MNMYTTEVKRLFKSFLLWSIVVVIILSIFLAFFPSMANSDMAALVKAKMSAIPEAMRNALGIGNMVDFSDLLQYFAYVLEFIFMAACIYSGILGVSAIIKEEGEGTIEFLYAKPISRTKIVTVKILSTLTIVILFNILLYIVCIAFAQAFKRPGYQYLNMLTIIFKSMLGVQVVFLSVGILFSTILRRYSQAIPFALGAFFITYILGTFSTIIDKLDWMKYLSPYHYAIPLNLLKSNGSMNATEMMLMFLIILLSIVGAYVVYKRKDLIT